MSKTQELAAAFLRKAQSVRGVPVRDSINAFNSLFAVQELNEHDSRMIEKILVDGFSPAISVEARVDQDANEVKRLTKELRAIKRQEQVLIGERIAQAREVFRRYQTRSFREWLELTFGSFKTGYNYLAFHDFYMALPQELRERLKEMPARAVYILASNRAPIEDKIGIVRDHSHRSAPDLIDYIRRSFAPRTDVSFDKKLNDKILQSLERHASLLRPHLFDAAQQRRLSKLYQHLKELVENGSLLKDERVL